MCRNKEIVISNIKVETLLFGEEEVLVYEDNEELSGTTWQQICQRQQIP